MSEEEKEAIEYFKSDLEMTKEMGKRWGFQEEIKNNEIILNLIDKLQKENSSLKKEIKLMKSVNINENFISKDKIRNKIKELEKEKDRCFNENGFVPYYLQLLLNTNNKIVILEELLGDDINEN